MRRAQIPQNSATAADNVELVRRARGRDEAAVRSIMQANNRRLFRIARGILRNDSEAEDVVQETYIRASRAGNQDDCLSDPDSRAELAASPRSVRSCPR